MITRSLLTGAIAALSLATAHAATVDFEDAGNPGNISYQVDAGGYYVNSGGLHFGNADVIDLKNGPGWWQTGVGGAHSGNYAEFNDFSGMVTVTQLGGGTFSVNDLWVAGWQGAGGTVTFTGYSGGQAVDTATFDYGTHWADAALGFANIDKLTMSGGLFFVDDMKINSAVPEPMSAMMMALALGLGFAAKRKRQQ